MGSKSKAKPVSAVKARRQKRAQPRQVQDVHQWRICRRAIAGAFFPVYDPSTEQIIAEVPDADEKDVDRAVAAARAAFDSGPGRKPRRKIAGEFFSAWPSEFAKKRRSFAELECRNSGKPIVEAEYDIADAATCFEYYGGMATKVLGHVNPVPDNALSLSLREPIGVAAQIIPWNYPLLMAAWKLAPAIAAGCTCILKPAEQTPLTALEFAGYLADAGLPPGVVNIITGFGETRGRAAWLGIRTWIRWRSRAAAQWARPS